MPYPFAGNAVTGEVRSYPSSFRFSRGKTPCQVFAICLPPGVNSSPQANSAAVEPAPGGKFPLGFGRQVLAGPFRISQGIAVGDVNDGMIIEPGERAARSIGSAPVGAKLERPPLAPVTQIDRMVWRRENQGTGPEHVRQSARVVLRVRGDLGERS